MQRIATTKKRPSTSPPPTPLTYDLAGIGVTAFGVISLVSLVSPNDAGELGKDISAVLRLLAGTGAFIVPLLACFIGAVLLFGRLRVQMSRQVFACIALWVVIISWLHVSVSGGNPKPLIYFSPSLMQAGGGYIGAGVSYFLLVAFGKISTLVILGALALGLAMMVIDIPIFTHLESYFASVRQSQPESKPQKQSKTVPGANSSQATSDADELTDDGKRAMIAKVIESQKRLDSEDTADLLAKNKVLANPMTNAESQPTLVLGEVPPEDKEFILPSIEFLEEPPPIPERSADELSTQVETIERTLNDFKIEANVVEIAHGPTVTRYEIELAPGIRVNKIVSLADNIAMSLAAINVRVEAPIPGKAAIGVEVPNRQRGMVGLKDLLRAPEMTNNPSKLAFPLGYDVAGQTMIADLGNSSTPHLLIAGATGMGKSVMLNSLICSLLFRSTPGELRMVMIDPKRVELTLYDGIPHLSSPVIRNPRGAAGILRAAVQEMERRYDRLVERGNKHISIYNSEVTPAERMPYLIIIIDELADLMMQAAQEVESSIVRLAQMSRAVGIHLVVATQRPSVDVVTGLIKANIASRIAFATSSHIDSRTILDQNGAERLIGKGDMLFRPMDAPKPTRIQGAFISEQEIKRLADHLKAQRTPDYTLTPVEPSMGERENGQIGSDDPALADEFFLPAVEMVIRQGRASTSMIQRRFRIGYTRAARLVDAMEQQGLVGAADGANPRDVLVSPDRIDEILGVPRGTTKSEEKMFDDDEEDAF